MPIHGNSGVKIGVDAGGHTVTAETRTFIPDQKRLKECLDFSKEHIPRVGFWELLRDCFLLGVSVSHPSHTTKIWRVSIISRNRGSLLSVEFETFGARINQRGLREHRDDISFE